MRGNWGGGLVIASDLDKAGMRGRSLAEARRSLVAGQHVRIAMLAKAAGGAWIRGIIPGTGAHLHDAGSDAVVDADPCQTSSAIIPDPDDIAIGKPSGSCIVRMDMYRLASRDLGRPAVVSVIKLTVQLCLRLI